MCISKLCFYSFKHCFVDWCSDFYSLFLLSFVEVEFGINFVVLECNREVNCFVLWLS